MVILGIITNKETENICRSTYIPFTTIMEEATLVGNGVRAVTIVIRSDDGATFGIDLKKMVHVHPMTRMESGEEVPISSWAEFECFLKDLYDRHLLRDYITKYTAPKLMWVSDTQQIETIFDSHSSTQLKIVGLENTLGTVMELGDLSDPYSRGKRDMILENKDIIISHVKDVDLKNSLPVIDGCVFRPVVKTNVETGVEEMFVLGAGIMAKRSAWNQKQAVTAEHYKIPVPGTVPEPSYYPGGEFAQKRSYCYNHGAMLIDVSPIGNLTVLDPVEGGIYTVDEPKLLEKYVPLSITDMAYSVRDWMSGIKQRYVEPGYWIHTTVRHMGPLTGRPVFCILGRLFTDTAMTTICETKHGVCTYGVYTYIPRRYLRTIILSNMQQYGRHIDDTTLVRVNELKTLKYLFDRSPIGPGYPEDVERVIYEDFQTPFVVVIDTSKELVFNTIHPKTTIKPDKLVFPKNSGGLLINERTGEIIDYTKQNYDHSTLVETSLQCPLRRETDDDPNAQMKEHYGYEFYESFREHKYKKYGDICDNMRDIDKFYLLDISVIGE